MNNDYRVVSNDVLNRHFVGFDRIFDRYANMSSNSYPPHNIIQVDNNVYEIEFALAGFSLDDIKVQIEDGNLIVSGSNAKTNEEETRTYIHRGISSREFEKQFRLAEHWEVTGAAFKDGILTISLKQEIPEAKKPKLIEIK